MKDFLLNVLDAVGRAIGPETDGAVLGDLIRRSMMRVGRGEFVDGYDTVGP